MALFDAGDFFARLVSTRARRWAGSASYAPPTAPGSRDAGGSYATLYPVGAQLAVLMDRIAYDRLQTRLATMTDTFLDLASLDFKGGRLPRVPGESNAAFSARLRASINAPTGCYAGVAAALASYFALAPDPTLIGTAVFDAQSDPARAAYYGLTAGQFGIVFYYPIPVRNEWPLGQRRLGYDSILADRSSFTKSTTSPYPALAQDVDDAKDWTYQPVYIVSMG